MDASFNPYAAPRATLEPDAPDAELPWRIEGRMLVARQGVTLPPVCLLTGAPAPGEHERRDLSWIPIWFRILIGIAPMIALFAYAGVRRRGNLEYALSPEARRRRRSGSMLGFAGVALSIGLFLLGRADDLPGVMGLAFLLGLVTVFVASARARMFRIKRIDKRHIHLELTPAAASAFARLQ
jgi:hypothetical protein